MPTSPGPIGEMPPFVGLHTQHCDVAPIRILAMSSFFPVGARVAESRRRHTESASVADSGGTAYRKHAAHTYDVCPNRCELATGCKDGNIRIWSLERAILNSERLCTSTTCAETYVRSFHSDCSAVRCDA